MRLGFPGKPDTPEPEPRSVVQRAHHDADHLRRILRLIEQRRPTVRAEAVLGIAEVVPPKRVTLTWGWAGSDNVPPGSSTVTFTLEPTPSGTLVRLVHTGLPSETCDQHLEGWLYFGGRMSVVAAGGDPDDS